jgi:hypothetical protein
VNGRTAMPKLRPHGEKWGSGNKDTKNIRFRC